MRCLTGMAEARLLSNNLDAGLFGAMVDGTKRYGPSGIALEDTVTGSLTRKRMLVGARVLGRRFAQMTEPGEAVGVLLPNANGAVLTFFGLQSGGRVAAMLNYTAGPANIASAIRTAKIKTVISSKAFIEKAELGESGDGNRRHRRQNRLAGRCARDNLDAGEADVRCCCGLCR